MRVRPKIFNSLMVKALLSGKKKTSRSKSNVFIGGERFDDDLSAKWYEEAVKKSKSARGGVREGVPAEIGDLLYVREKFQGPIFEENETSKYIECRSEYKKNKYCVYAATDPKPTFYDVDKGCTVSKWTSPIHAPKWSSRITLRVTNVYMERLSEIAESQEKIEKEGFSSFEEFKMFWREVYGEPNLDSFVWVTEYEVICQNVDDYLNSIGVQQ